MAQDYNSTVAFCKLPDYPRLCHSTPQGSVTPDRKPKAAVSERINMGQPVVHFEIIGSNPTTLRGFFNDLFGWEFDTSGTVAEAISEPTNYGFIDLITASDGSGIRGGIGGGERYERHVVFYVGVSDVEEALQKVEGLGGQRQMGPVTAPNGLVIGHFKDPEGNLIGLASST
jgi:predicted enzyme related to lactoylglutathione lyase